MYNSSTSQIKNFKPLAIFCSWMYLCLTWSETPKKVFLVMRLIIDMFYINRIMRKPSRRSAALLHMSSVMRKPAFYICKIKAQISCTVTAQRLCLRYIKHTIPLLHKSRERGGSVVEYGLWSERTGARNLPTSASCILEQDTFLPESTGNTQKVRALS